MEVSIVIVNYNGKELLKTSLDSIKKHTAKNHEIIVVDNNSDDGSVEFLRKNHKNVKIIRNKKNLGYSGINSALHHCGGKYIFFLNNDITIDKNCIGNMLKAIKKDEKIGMIAPKLVNFYDKKRESAGTWVSRAFYNGHIGGRGKLMDVPYLGVGLLRKKTAEKFGYIFDPDYFIYAEDLDLGLRIRLIGQKVVFVPSAILNHMHAMTTKNFESSFTTFLLERNLLTTFLKILSFKNIILFLPYVTAVRIIAIAKDLVSFRFSNAFARIRAIFWIIFNFNKITEKRKKLQKLREADDNFILRVFSEKYLLKKKIIV